MKLFELPRNIVKNRRLMFSLAKNDFKTKFAGSYLGIIWAFIQPVVTILVYWFVFQVGLRSPGDSGVPFVLYLTVGIVPWFFFADSLNGGASTLLEYNYLVKKVVFDIDILPVVKIISAMFVHIFFICFMTILLCLYGFYPTLYSLQIFYYMFCTFMLVLALAYLFSAIAVFFRDITQIINILILQVGIWLTPIMWNARNMLSPTLHGIFKLNPMYYIVDGFRDSFLYHRVFFIDKPWWTLYFWGVTILLYFFGTGVFKRLKVHFADVL